MLKHSNTKHRAWFAVTYLILSKPKAVSNYLTEGSSWMPGLHHVAPLHLSHHIVTQSHTAAHKFKVIAVPSRFDVVIALPCCCCCLVIAVVVCCWHCLTRQLVVLWSCSPVCCRHLFSYSCHDLLIFSLLLFPILSFFKAMSSGLKVDWYVVVLWCPSSLATFEQLCV